MQEPQGTLFPLQPGRAGGRAQPAEPKRPAAVPVRRSSCGAPKSLGSAGTPGHRARPSGRGFAEPSGPAAALRAAAAVAATGQKLLAEELCHSRQSSRANR